ncbi:MAG: DUF6100 family protein [Eubacteriaceae bacterium]
MKKDIKRLGELQNQLETLKKLNLQISTNFLVEYLEIAEKYILKIRNLYVLDYSVEQKNTEEELKNTTRKILEVGCDTSDENHITINLPLRLLKKKRDRYLLETLSICLEHYIKKPLFLKNRIVVFEFAFMSSKALDYDNIEVSSILNVLTKCFIFDDSPNFIDLYFCSKQSMKNETIIHVFGKEEFIFWINKERYDEESK